MTPGRRPEPGPQGDEGAHPQASLPPQLPGLRGAGRPGATLHKDAGPPTPRGPGSLCGYLLSAAWPAAHRERRTYAPPRQRGARQPQGSRVGGAWPGPLPACQCVVGALTEAACVEYAEPAATSGRLCSARYVRGRRRCLIFLRRETCSVPRPRAGHAHSRARPRTAPTGYAVNPSATDAVAGLLLRLALPGARRRQLRRRGAQSLGVGTPRGSVSKRRGEQTRTIFQRGGARCLFCIASTTQAGKDREMER